MPPLSLFLPHPPLLPPRRLHSHSRPRTCPLPPLCSRPPPPDGIPSSPTPIPSGARLIPPDIPDTFDTPLNRSLSHLRFGYETTSPLPSPASFSACTLRYRCAHGHIVRGRAGSPACKVCPTCAYEMGTACTRASAFAAVSAGGVMAKGKAGGKLSLCQVAALAYARGGVLLSTVYENARKPLVWKCAEGHVWKASVGNVRGKGSWCPECARRRRKLTVEEMRAMAREKGGECLSDEYISEHVKLRWRCKRGHDFWLAPNNVRRKKEGARKATWCKVCRRDMEVQMRGKGRGR